MGAFWWGVNTVGFLQYFEAVDWVTGRPSDVYTIHLKTLPVALISKGSVQVK